MAQKPTGKRPSVGGTIAKIAFGIMFIGVSGGDPGESDRISFIVVSITVGLALIAWGLLPWLRVWREEKRRRLAEERQREEAARLRAERKAEKENEPKVCPNCGAPGRGRVCEYCGSVLP
ncbi:MAG: hypothetical protein IJK35_05945 [Oscillospiraceae bacterium]|nr:hypothetical protein [Oscillospiraceae bacterium]